MKYFTLLIMALTSFAMPGWFRKLRSRLPHWNAMSNSQKVALVSFISLALLLPIITLATLEGTRLTSKANMPVTPPITPTPTPTQTSWGNAIYFKNATNSNQTYLTLTRGSTEKINLNNTFTLEFWFKLDDLSSYRQSIVEMNDGHLLVYIEKDSNGFDKMRVYVGNETNWSLFYATGGVIQTGVWNHFALSYIPSLTGGSFMSYLNGKSTYNSNQPFTDNGVDLLFSHTNKFTSWAPGILNGSLEELRISNIARYPYQTGPGEYIMPSTSFIPDEKTLALFHFNQTFSDSSNNLLSLTPFGPVEFGPSLPTSIPTPTPTPTPRPNAIPVITTTSLPSVILNRQYTATIAGYDLDETDTLSLAVSGLPAGLRQDKCALSVVRSRAVITCTLTGRALQAGNYPVTIILTDNRGGKTSKVLSLRIVRTAENN